MGLKKFTIHPVLLGLVLLLLSETARIFHVTGVPGLFAFFLPVMPLYLLLSKALDDGWERFLISSSLYIALMGLLLFIWRLILFLPIDFRALFLLVDFFVIAFSGVLTFEGGGLRLGFLRKFDWKREMPVFLLLVFVVVFYSAAATKQDSWQKELRNVKWAMAVSTAFEGDEKADILQFPDHVPFHAVLGAITANLFGFSQLSKVVLHVIFAVFDVLVLVLLSQFMFKSRRPGFFAVFFLISSGLFMHYTTTAYYGATAIGLQLLTFYVLYRYMIIGNSVFFYLIPFFYAMSVYAKPESSIFIVPVLFFVLLKKKALSWKRFEAKRLEVKQSLAIILLTLVLFSPVLLYLYEADAALNGNFGPVKYNIKFLNSGGLSVSLINLNPGTVFNINRFTTFFPGLAWGIETNDRSVLLRNYLRMFFSGELDSTGTKVSIAGFETVAGSFYETPQAYLIYAISLFYFCRKYSKAYPLLVGYMLFGFFFVFLFFNGVSWNHIATPLFLGFLALGLFFTGALEKLRHGTITNATTLAVLCFFLISSFVYTANTAFNFDYYSGTNFYRDPLFQSYPVFGTFAIGKYIREHTSAAETNLADTCYLSEAITNRNAWVGAGAPAYLILPDKNFYNYRLREIKNQKNYNYTYALGDKRPAAIFQYEGFPYAELYKANKKDRYLDEGVCIEASEYGKYYGNWGLFFSNPAGSC